MPGKVDIDINGSPDNVPTNGSVPVKKPVVESVRHLIDQSYLRFAWFLGNLGVVFSALFYVLKFRSNGWFKFILYKSIFVDALVAFGIVLYQNRAAFYSNKGSFQIRSVLQDDNTHYFYNASIWLLLPKQSSLSIVSYVSFSTFHVLTFLSNLLFPALNLPERINGPIIKFTKEHHELSRLIAANSELLLLIVLIFRSFLFKKYSWISLGLFAVFIKVKIEGSIFTKSILKNWEVRVDGLVSSPKVPPAVKSTWVSFKRVLKNINKVSIIKQVEAKIEN